MIVLMTSFNGHFGSPDYIFGMFCTGRFGRCGKTDTVFVVVSPDFVVDWNDPQFLAAQAKYEAKHGQTNGQKQNGWISEFSQAYNNAAQNKGRAQENPRIR